jgi:hypothetical protein
MEPSPQAKKLVEQHVHAIDTQGDEASRKFTSAQSVLAAVCSLLNLRQKYFGATGEHFSVHEYDGIQVIDQLDERLLRHVRAMLQAYADRARKKADPTAIALLGGRLTPAAKEMRKYRGGHMLHHKKVAAFQGFEPLVEAGHGFGDAGARDRDGAPPAGDPGQYVLTRARSP